MRATLPPNPHSAFRNPHTATAGGSDLVAVGVREDPRTGFEQIRERNYYGSPENPLDNPDENPLTEGKDLP